MPHTLTQEARAWRAVVLRVRWATFALGLVANFIVVSAVVGWHANSIYSRLANVEQQAEDTDRNLASIDARHQTRMTQIEGRQQIADNLSARLEERLIAQGTTLERIEGLLRALAGSAPTNPNRDPR